MATKKISTRLETGTRRRTRATTNAQQSQRILEKILMKTPITVAFPKDEYIVMNDGYIVERISRKDEEKADQLLKQTITEWVDDEWELWQISGIQVWQIVITNEL